MIIIIIFNGYRVGQEIGNLIFLLNDKIGILLNITTVTEFLDFIVFLFCKWTFEIDWNSKESMDCVARGGRHCRHKRN